MKIRLTVLPMLLILAMVAWDGIAALGAGSDVLDAQRRVELNSGTAAQRSAVLAWLAEHGTQTETDAVVPRLKDTDGAIRALAETTLWSMWLHSGDTQADSWMDEGQLLLSGGDFAGATALFTRIVERLPDFAEGYNKRATALYLAGDYEGSLKDIAEVLKRNPAHFGALSGAGLCLLKLGRPQEALFYFERGLQVNPNMEGIRSMTDALRAHAPRERA